MSSTISAARVATLVAGFDRSPAYAGLADALGVSRTTVTRAYVALRETGYAEARQGAGTFTRVPGGRARAHDRALLPRPGDSDAIDLNCAAPSAPPGLAAAYAGAAADLPPYLGGHGYFPAGLVGPLIAFAQALTLPRISTPQCPRSGAIS